MQEHYLLQTVLFILLLNLQDLWFYHFEGYKWEFFKAISNTKATCLSFIHIDSTFNLEASNIFILKPGAIFCLLLTFWSILFDDRTKRPLSNLYDFRFWLKIDQARILSLIPYLSSNLHVLDSNSLSIKVTLWKGKWLCKWAIVCSVQPFFFFLVSHFSIHSCEVKIYLF